MTIASQLRLWRNRRGVSISALAVASGVAKSTLSRWEGNQNLPDVEPLELVLEALSCSPEERLLALSLVNRPRTNRRLVAIDEASVNLAQIGSSHPGIGAIMRTARWMAGFTLRQVADLLEVEVGTVSQWESGHRIPSPSARSHFCDLIVVDDAVRMSIAKWNGDPHPIASVGDLAERQERLIDTSLASFSPTATLELTALANEAWRLAQHSGEAAAILGRLWSALALIFFERNNLAVAEILAKRACDLPYWEIPRPNRTVPPEIELAYVHSIQGNTARTERAILNLDLPISRCQDLGDLRRLHSEAAILNASLGRRSESFWHFAQASDVTEKSGSDRASEILSFVKAECLLQLGQGEAALRSMPVLTSEPVDIPSQYGPAAQALISIGELDAAEQLIKSMQNACRNFHGMRSRYTRQIAGNLQAARTDPNRPIVPIIG